MNGKHPMNNETIAATVNTSQGDYRILVGSGIIGNITDELVKCNLTGRVFLVADRALPESSIRTLRQKLGANDYQTELLILDLVESNKNMDTAKTIYSWLSQNFAERRDIIISMGGGVAGDLVGFVAATWLRGVPFIQIPTTLASMVDASIGGKVAINLPDGKNLVGAFYQPKLVIQDIELLSSLPKRELNSGWAEVIKHGLILDRELFYQLEHIGNSYKNELTSKRMISAIRYSVKIKSDVVSADEYETGDTRILLNYGHTIGHALEKITKYKKFLHGEAVAIGMMVAARISYRIGMIELGVIQRQQAILQQFNLPVYFEKIDVNSLIEATRSDKKTREGSINWVLLTGIGTSTIQSDVPTSLVAEAIEETKHQRN